MTVRQLLLGTLAAAVCAAVGVVQGADAPKGQPFLTIQSGFTDDLFGVSSSFLTPQGYLGGVAVLPNGDVYAAECVRANTRLHRFSATQTTSTNDQSVVHVETILPSAGGCGLVYHPDGTLYLNMNDGVHGVANVNASTGAPIRLIGPPGNALGIAVDPITNHLVYAASDCVAGTDAASPTTCTLIDLDPAGGRTTTLVQFDANEVGYVDGLYFDPTGSYLFVDNRYPSNRLTIVARTGAIVQHVDIASEPAGIAFHAGTSTFVVTNNTDATMTRFDFPNNDYSAAPFVTTFATGGYRGDLAQVGPDGCIYATQDGARYADFVENPDVNSIARVCGGFSTPAGLPPPPPPPPAGVLEGTVTNAGTGAVLAGATVVVGDTLTATTNTAGRYSVSLPPGTYSATASASGFMSLTYSNVAVKEATITTRNFALVRFTDLALSATAPPQALSGGTLTYTFTAYNGSTAGATNVQVTHALPAAATFAALSAPTGWTCTRPAIGGTGSVTCAKSTMAASEAAAIAITVTVPCPYPSPSMTVSGKVASGSPDSNLGNNTASAVTRLSTPVPTISPIAVSATDLWPPNHRMVDVQLAYTTSGLMCSTSQTAVRVNSNQPSNGDVLVVDGYNLRLRAERDGNRGDRVYSITVVVSNDLTAVATQTATVVVPHDQRKK